MNQGRHRLPNHILFICRIFRAPSQTSTNINLSNPDSNIPMFSPLFSYLLPLFPPFHTLSLSQLPYSSTFPPFPCSNFILLLRSPSILPPLPPFHQVSEFTPTVHIQFFLLNFLPTSSSCSLLPFPILLFYCDPPFLYLVLFSHPILALLSFL